MSLNLLYKNATVNPTINPPNTDVLSCLIPNTLPNIYEGRPPCLETTDPNAPSV